MHVSNILIAFAGNLPYCPLQCDTHIYCLTKRIWIAYKKMSHIRNIFSPTKGCLISGFYCISFRFKVIFTPSLCFNIRPTILLCLTYLVHSLSMQNRVKACTVHATAVKCAAEGMGHDRRTAQRRRRRRRVLKVKLLHGLSHAQAGRNDQQTVS